MVQFYPWFKFYFLLLQTRSLLYITIPKNKKEIEFKHRIKLSHNIYFGKYLQLKHAVSILEKISVSKILNRYRKESLGDDDVPQV